MPPAPAPLPSAAKGEATFLRLIAGARSAADVFPSRLHEASRGSDVRTAEVPERVLLTFLFTDIVASTETAERLGDHAWCRLLMEHHAIVRSQLARFGGIEMDTAGDGFFVVFDRPSRAMQFAAAVRSALAEIGLGIRVGVHAGECEIAGGRAEGVAVHVAARVAGVASQGEILVSSTVRDLLAGSELRFSGRDVHTFKGLAEPRFLFALES
ncbi:MAG TPA: adenylate/guanylate cyclase domain-containing protein [Caldimonas sp.]|jgi:class 3 adenylate cyclase